MKPKYKPQQTFSVAKDGFFGEYYPATGEKFKGKSLVIFGGSAGRLLWNHLKRKPIRFLICLKVSGVW